MVSCGICGQPVTYERLNEHRAGCSPRRRERAPEPEELLAEAREPRDDDDEPEDAP
jgi:endogenous inhibitor of DNA gyrase (YacG/DUF329 family)